MNDANLDSLVERTVSNAMQQNQNQFLSDMKNVIQNQFERMEERVTNSQREMNDFQLKRLQSLTNESYVFKRKGNEAQFKFNNEVKGRLDLADTCLKDNPEQGSEKALSYISEGINLRTNIDNVVRESGLEDNAENRRLAENMMGYLCLSKSENTRRKYYLAYVKWKHFISGKGHVDMPANPVHIAMYLTYLLDKGASFHVVSGAKYAIKWAHNLNGFPDVTDHVFVNNIVESAKRIAKPKTAKKDPVNSEDLIMLCDKYSDNRELSVVRDLCMTILGFAGKRYLASDFNFTYRYIDDVLSINNSKFADYLSSTYPSELEVKEITETNNSASYLDIMLSYDTDGHMNTSLYDKRDDFNFSITNFPFLSSNIPSSPAYGVFISQLMHYARASTQYTDFVLRARRLSDKLLSQGYVCDRLTSSLRKFYGRYGELVIHYDVPLSRMVDDNLS
ncbi:hypothetical protein FSP39_009957 [Pinctada imbricata]|uniref:Uncharacterized protein n=1 Tax=Pinctada imbricata TaxID=66713 RepID=A0AA89BJ51_PINIB|nr:hypothetical protein FSP39_009957 [Pinctada imbricata]